MTTAAASLNDRLAAYFAGDAELTRDPYPLYDALRADAPVREFANAIVVTSHAEAKHVYHRNDLFQNNREKGRFTDSTRLLSDAELVLLDEVIAFEQNYMSSMNGDRHRRVRGAAQRSFTPRRLQELGDLAQQLTDEMLDELSQQETCDLIQLCYRVPLLVIGDMLGAPREDAAQLKRLGDAINGHKHFSPIPPEKVRNARAAVGEFQAYARELVERSRRTEATRLAGSLIGGFDEGLLTEDELAASMVIILFAGHETTTNLMGNGTLALLRFRDQWELLCANPDLAANAVEELFRYDAPVQGMARRAIVDTELGGVPIPEGTRVRMMNGAANRDPKAFAEPDRVDITRRPVDHLSLGFGAHFCLGGPLARLEGRVVFSTLARRFPDMELAVPLDEIEWNGDPQLRGLKQLPVRLGRDRGRAA